MSNPPDRRSGNGDQDGASDPDETSHATFSHPCIVGHLSSNLSRRCCQSGVNRFASEASIGSTRRPRCPLTARSGHRRGTSFWRHISRISPEPVPRLRRRLADGLAKARRHALAAFDKPERRDIEPGLRANGRRAFLHDEARCQRCCLGGLL